MPKNTRRSASQQRIEDFAKRRAGASYSDAAEMAETRLLQMKEEYENVPPSYRGYLLVGICTCLESHLKYYYAAAAEAFDDHPDLLHQLYKDTRAEPSGLALTAADAALIRGMIERGDRHHDIAAFFGVNQGRIAEVKDGSRFPGVPAATKDLPPKGPYLVPKVAWQENRLR
jgi:hypothetical protein